MSIKTKTELKAYNNTNITSNGIQAITGEIVNTMNDDMIDSFLLENEYGYVPYLYATDNVNVGDFNIEAMEFIAHTNDGGYSGNIKVEKYEVAEPTEKVTCTIKPSDVTLTTDYDVLLPSKDGTLALVSDIHDTLWYVDEGLPVNLRMTDPMELNMVSKTITSAPEVANGTVKLQLQPTVNDGSVKLTSQVDSAYPYSRLHMRNSDSSVSLLHYGTSTDIKGVELTPDGVVLIGQTIDVIEDGNNKVAVTKEYINSKVYEHPDWYRGWNRSDPDSMGTITYDTSTRNFSISVLSGQTEFSFYAGGNYYTYTDTESVNWPDITGTHYFYFDIDSDLQTAQVSTITEEIFTQSAICGLVYWNATTGEAIVQAIDEQHGEAMPSADHFLHHMTLGAMYSKGGDITGIVDGNDNYTSVDSLLSFDEDIPISNNSGTTHPFIWREGSDGAWVQSTVFTNEVGYTAPGDTYTSWNEKKTGIWQLTESVNTTDYIIYYMLWTNDKDYPIKKIVGQQAYPSRSDAMYGMETELGNIKLGGLPSEETYFMYAWIVKRNGDIEKNSSTDNTYVDLRGPLKFATK